MGKLIAIKPDGTTEEVESKKLDLEATKKLIGNGCEIVERVKVRFEGRVRDCWLDEEGWCKPNVANRHVKRMAEEYFGRDCQEFGGVGVIWVPNA